MSLFRRKSIEKIVQDAEAGLVDGHHASGLKKVFELDMDVNELTPKNKNVIGVKTTPNTK